MINLRRIFYVFAACLFLVNAKAQTMTGFVSRKPSAASEGCGCTGCNDAAYIGSVNYPDPTGGCGTTEPAASSGACTRLTKTTILVIPAGCTVTAVGYMGDRPGCAGTSNGPGMDANDEFSITGSLGTVNGATGIMTGASNALVTSPVITQVGGQLAFYMKADRIAEILTYTVTYAAVGCTPSPLPLQLLSFTADVDQDEINLKWSTVSEKHMLGYEVEYSFDAINFQKQASVAAAGNIYDVNYYNSIIPNNFSTKHVYFRLKLMNREDNYSYSPILSLADIDTDDLVIMPNPTPTGDVIIRSNKRKDTNSVLRILNSTGNTIHETGLKSPEDHIDLKKFGKGLYFFYLINNEKTTLKKVIYQ